MLEQRFPAKTFEDALAHVVRRLDVERDARHHAQRAEAHDQAAEVGVAPGRGHDLAVGGDDLHSGDSRREIPVGIARSVCGCGDGSGNRDMRQGGEVGQRHPLAPQRPGQLPVRQSGGEGHRTLAVVHHHLGGQAVEREQLSAITDVRERVTRTDNPQLVCGGDDLLHLLQR